LTKATNVASNYGYGYGYGYGAKYGGVDSKRNPISLITDGSNA
jgi:hypothetical protein